MEQNEQNNEQNNGQNRRTSSHRFYKSLYGKFLTLYFFNCVHFYPYKLSKNVRTLWMFPFNKGILNEAERCK